jgi:hypothetical protein
MGLVCINSPLVLYPVRPMQESSQDIYFFKIPYCSYNSGYKNRSSVGPW